MRREIQQARARRNGMDSTLAASSSSSIGLRTLQPQTAAVMDIWTSPQASAQSHHTITEPFSTSVGSVVRAALGFLGRFSPAVETTESEIELLQQRLQGCGFSMGQVQLEQLQYEGIRWIMEREQSAGWKGGILADEMGLGKTVQMLCAIATNKVPTLVVCPLSAFESWKEDVRNFFAPGTFALTDFHRLKKLPHPLPSNSLTLVNPELLGRDVWAKPPEAKAAREVNLKSKLLNAPFQRIICDEAQFLKNLMSPKGQNINAKACDCIAAKASIRWCMTGTPIENGIKDYLSLLTFLKAEPFCRPDWFHDHVERHVGTEFVQDPLFAQCFRETVLRRSKASLQNLPETHFHLLESSMDPTEKEQEAALLDEEESGLVRQLRSGQAAGSLAMPRSSVQDLQEIQALSLDELKDRARKPCELGGLGQELRPPSQEEEAQRQWCLSKFCFERAWIEADKEKLLKSSKWTSLESTLRKIWNARVRDAELECAWRRDEKQFSDPWRSDAVYWTKLDTHENTKVVLISRFSTRSFELAAKLMSKLNIRYVKIDQSVAPEDRGKIIDSFNNDPAVKVMLLGMKCGGSGINLPGAQVAILMDSWWTPAAEQQAINRIHRLNSAHKHVYFVKLFSRNNDTEQRQSEIHQQKLRVCQQTLGLEKAQCRHHAAGMGDEVPLQKLDTAQLQAGGDLSHFGLKRGCVGWHHNTLLDGELVLDVVEEGKTALRYLVYDAMHICGEDLTHRTLIYRLQKALYEVILPKEQLSALRGSADNVQLMLKDFFELWQLGEVTAIASELPHGTDGLVFTPVMVPYVPGTVPALLKWKPAEMNTVDFKLQVIQEGDSTRNMHVKLLVGFKQRDAWQVKHTGHWLAKMGDMFKKLREDPAAFDGKIAECKWNASAKTFTPSDQLKFTVNGTWEDGGWVLQRLRELLGSILGASGGRMFGRFSCWSPPPVRPQYDPLEELQQDINLHDLPALRQRGPNYYWGPWLCLVVVFAFIFESVGLPTMASQNYDSPFLDMVVLPVVWIAAFAAVFTLVSIVFGDTGEIRRSEASCYPIPDRARALILLGSSKSEDTPNIAGLDGQSYCTRCCVWRPEGSHHCSTCQRCVTGFDHHCSFFGRCITRRNMCSFRTIIGLFFVGAAAQMITVAITNSAPARSPSTSLHATASTAMEPVAGIGSMIFHAAPLVKPTGSRGKVCAKFAQDKSLPNDLRTAKRVVESIQDDLNEEAQATCSADFS
ncbi:TTF2 [Symbiodinium sp. KB8]|nr:TTF2 [Symbiodinium sp. KB8]